MVGKEKVIPILYGMLFPIGCANIPHNKQPIEHVLKIPISKPGDRDRPPLYRKVGFMLICICILMLMLTFDTNVGIGNI